MTFSRFILALAVPSLLGIAGALYVRHADRRAGVCSCRG